MDLDPQAVRRRPRDPRDLEISATFAVAGALLVGDAAVLAAGGTPSHWAQPGVVVLGAFMLQSGSGRSTSPAPRARPCSPCPPPVTSDFPALAAVVPALVVSEFILRYIAAERVHTEEVMT